MYFRKQDQKHDTLDVIDNYNLYDTPTDTRTWRLYDRPGPDGRVCENAEKRQIGRTVCSNDLYGVCRLIGNQILPHFELLKFEIGLLEADRRTFKCD